MMLKESEKDYRIYDLAKMNIKPCVGCAKCAKNNRCVMEDDMFSLPSGHGKGSGFGSCRM
ncbi:MAG: hypothetical protein DRH24_00915 [Deltaproteobacteria bacterium]|nr:MAG: hypothetical protein DRH24_00915 [Deltaproteobacteria bacterium]